MYERRTDGLLPKDQFLVRVARHGGYVFVAILGALAIGMLGYHSLSGLAWIDAFAEASMILSGMGPLHEPHTTASKMFAGCFALFSGLFFIGVTGVLLAPFLHRMIHIFHLEKAQK